MSAAILALTLAAECVLFFAFVRTAAPVKRRKREGR